MGAIFDKLFYFGIGIYFIYLSIKKKEKLGGKVVLVRLGGIILIGLGILYTIIAFFKK